MSNADFQSVCGIVLVAPEVAIENELVRDFLKKNKGKGSSVTSQLILAGILRTEF